jgi:predicted lipoprotein with Yx(FWY)xxD motif
MRKTPTGALAPTLIALALTVALGACNRHEAETTAVAEPATPAATDSTSASEPAEPSVGTLVVAGDGNDRYLTDNAGRAVYVLEGDDTGTRCVDDCLRVWPVVGGAAPVSGVPEVDGALIATTTRADGTVQVTYAGHPLYYFADDTEIGVTNGRDVNDKFGTWSLVRPTGEMLTASLSDEAAATAEAVSNRADLTPDNANDIDVDTDSEETEPPEPAKY